MRHKNTNWRIDPIPPGTDQAQLAVLMDIRDELQTLNRVLSCRNFLEIPFKLDRIEKNTKRPERKNKVPK